MKVAFVLIVLVTNLLYCHASAVEEDIDEFPNAEIKVVSITKKEIENAVDAALKNVDVTGKISGILEGTKDDADSYNSRADDIISDVKEELLMGPWDPAEIDGHVIAFTYRPLLITYSGTLTLSIGRIQDLSTLSRNGDATVAYTFPANTATISIPLAFRNIIASYNFLMRVRGDTVRGVLYAWVNGITANYSLTVDVDTKAIVSSSLNLVIGSLDIDVQSASISRAYTNVITELTTELMHDVVTEEADNIVGSLLNNAILEAI